MLKEASKLKRASKLKLVRHRVHLTFIYFTLHIYVSCNLEKVGSLCWILYIPSLENKDLCFFACFVLDCEFLADDNSPPLDVGMHGSFHSGMLLFYGHTQVDCFVCYACCLFIERIVII